MQNFILYIWMKGFRLHFEENMTELNKTSSISSNKELKMGNIHKQMVSEQKYYFFN